MVKTDKAIKGALLHRVERIHVESGYELLRVAKIAQELGVVASILLRVNVAGALPDATLLMAGEHSQFGIDENQIADMIGLAQSFASVKLEGFHLHSLSNNLSWERHVKLVSYYCDLVARWSGEYGLNLTYLNAGGGIGVNYANLQEPFDWGSFTAALHDEVKRKLPAGMTIMFECGRYITASCGYYATEVVDVKSNHGRRFALIRGGTHHFRLPSSWGHNHPFQIVPFEEWGYPFSRPELGAGPVTIAGELCTPKDVLARDCVIPGVRVGDVIVFLHAGAYGWAISHHDFLSHSHPAHYYLD
jgi:diaminopimelate decarboxylase